MLQAYIHSRMRRRTADFLQGKYLNDSLFKLGNKIDTRSAQQGKTGERGERTEDSERSNIQSSGIIMSRFDHWSQCFEITAT